MRILPLTVVIPQIGLFLLNEFYSIFFYLFLFGTYALRAVVSYDYDMNGSSFKQMKTLCFLP